MTRNLKILGLALVTAFAMSAVVASAASATEFDFHTETTPTTLTGVQHAGNGKIKFHGGTFECENMSYEGTIAAGPSTMTEVTVVPTYSGCKAFGFINISIHMDGCGYLFTTHTKVGASFEGTVHIECPNTDPNKHDEHAITTTIPGCEVTIPAQTPTGGTITFTNIGSGNTREITMDLNLTGIHYTEHERSGFPNCKAGGDTVTTTNGTFEGSMLLTGENPVNSAHHGIWVG